jgi:hypothetical protein
MQQPPLHSICTQYGLAEFHQNKLLRNTTRQMFLIRALAHADIDSPMATAPMPIVKPLLK